MSMRKRANTVAGKAGSTRRGRKGRPTTARRSVVLLVAAAIAASALAATAPVAAEESRKPFSALDQRVPPPPPQATDAQSLEEPKARAQDSARGPLPAPEGAEKEAPKERELVERRTDNSATFAQIDGTYKTVVSPGRMHYRERDGKWQKPDNTLVSERAPGYALANKTNGYRAQLPADLEGAPVRVSAGDDWVSFALDGAKGRPTAKDNRADYKGALKGVDVSYSATNVGLKEELTLAGPDSPSRYSFSMQTSPGLMPTLADDGSVQLRRGDQVPLSFSPPTIVDANGVTGPVRAELSPRPQGPALTLVADEGWLRDASRAWPVVLDPTVTIDWQDMADECGIAANSAYRSCFQSQ